MDDRVIGPKPLDEDLPVENSLRPQRLEDYIGQKTVKENLRVFIQDGDIILVEQRQTAENGESVVAMINGERVTLKRFYVEADGIRLQPANPAMEPIYLRHEELQILGIVAGVIRQS